jgi:hypothetical protein
LLLFCDTAAGPSFELRLCDVRSEQLAHLHRLYLLLSLSFIFTNIPSEFICVILAAVRHRGSPVCLCVRLCG